MLLKQLTDLHGVSGNEEEVRDFILSSIQKKVTEVTIDSMGNIIALKKAKHSKVKVMVAAHMDEVGFIVTGFGDLGSIQCKPVGGIDERILPGKRVLVGQKKLPGFFGIKPIHQQDPEERRSVISMKKLWIEIGADRKEETEKHVSLGDFISFDTEYTDFGDECIRAKALDDRVGCAVLMELLDGEYDFDLYACFTVQEEVGLRGAEIVANRVKPDIAIILEGTTCSDVPGVEAVDYSTLLGKGPALTIMDRTAIMDKPLVRWIEECAVRNHIPFQFKQTVSGGNDAGKIQRSGTGARVAVVSVPIRYIHSPVSVMKKKDYENMKRLIIASLQDITKWWESITAERRV